MSGSARGSCRGGSVIWHDVECGGYAADLELWEGLAKEAGGSVLDVGCGTGRVGRRLAKVGHRVIGLDIDAPLVDAFNEGLAGLPARAVVGDARDMDFKHDFALVLAPMQLVQLLADRAERISCLLCVSACMKPGALAAFAIVERMPPPVADPGPQLPDVRQVDGWVYSSLPLEPQVGSDSIVLHRRRQTVDPDGGMSEELNTVELQLLAAATLEHEAGEVGLRPVGRHEIPPTDAHVGSTVVLLEKGA